MAEMVEEDLHQFLHLRRIVLSEFLLELRGNVEVVGRLLLLLVPIIALLSGYYTKVSILLQGAGLFYFMRQQCFG